MDRFKKVQYANATVKKINFGEILGLLQLTDNTTQVELIRKFLNNSNFIIQSYLSKEDLNNAYNKMKNKYNGTDKEYRKINPLPSLEDVIEQFYKNVPKLDELSDEELLYELSKVAFYSNKVTKMICLPEKNRIHQKFANKDFQFIKSLFDSELNDDDLSDKMDDNVKYFYDEYKSIMQTKYASNEDREKDINNLRKRLTRFYKSKFEGYYQAINQGDFEKEKQLGIEDEEFQEEYKKYSEIMFAEQINYYIKSIAIRRMFLMLANDNYKNYKDWGFYRDDNGNLVFALDYLGEKSGTFQFHVEDNGDKVIDFDTDIDFDKEESYHFINSEKTKKTTKSYTLLGKKDTSIVTEQLIKRLENPEEQYRAYIANGFEQSVRSAHVKKENRNLAKKDKEFFNKIREYLGKEDCFHVIAIQQGNNLDINASCYAMQKLAFETADFTDICEIDNMQEFLKLRDKGIEELSDEEKRKMQHTLYIVRIPAGQRLEDAINIDTGRLKGITLMEDSQRFEINADERNGEKSACSILAKLGIYVPASIVSCADTIYDERILDANWGLVLSRELKGKKLFEFADTYRDGKSLLKQSLTEDEIEEFDLQSALEKRKKEVAEGIETTQKYGMVTPDGHKIVIAPKFLSNGSYYAYAMGYENYISINKHQSGKGATFAITANPNVNNGVLTENILNFGNKIRLLWGDGIFVSDNKNMVIAGGPKNKDFKIYPAYSAREAQIMLLENIRAVYGLEIQNSKVYEIMERIASQCIKYPEHIKKFFSHKFDVKTGKTVKGEEKNDR